MTQHAFGMTRSLLYDEARHKQAMAVLGPVRSALVGIARSLAKAASGIETEGHDPQGHGAKHESPTAEGGDAQ
jgi:hypothetical protein